MRRKIAALAIFAIAMMGTMVWIESAVHSAASTGTSFSERWSAAEDAIRSGTFREGPAVQAATE